MGKVYLCMLHITSFPPRFLFRMASGSAAVAMQLLKVRIRTPLWSQSILTRDTTTTGHSLKVEKTILACSFETLAWCQRS